MTDAQDDIENMLGARSTVSGHLREDHCLPPSPSLQCLLTGFPIPGPGAPCASPQCSDLCLRTMLLLLLPRCEEVREPRWGGVRGAGGSWGWAKRHYLPELLGSIMCLHMSL